MGAIENAFLRETESRVSAQKADTRTASTNRISAKKADTRTAGSTFTHEAEVQRQHSRHRIPVKVVLRDNIFRTTDWSLGGMGVDMSGIDWQEEFGDSLRVGDIVPLELLFEFVGFKFSMSVSGEVRNWESTTQQSSSMSPSVKSNLPMLSFGKDEETDALQRLGLQFVDLTPQQLAFLRFLLDAFIAGELVDAADLLEVAARVHPVSPRTLPKRELPVSFGGRMAHFAKRTAIWATVGIATLFLVSAVSASVYKRAFVIPAQSAFVTADVIVMTAPTAGMLTSLLPEGQETITRGSPIAGIQNDSLAGVTVESPCNCRVVARKARVGMHVTQGENLLVLAPDTAKPYGLARLTPNQALALQSGTTVQVGLGDGATATPGIIREIRRHSSLWAGDQRTLDPGAPVEVLIDFAGDVPLTAIGTPLAVEFDTFADSRLNGFLRRWMAGADRLYKAAAAQAGSDDPDDLGRPETAQKSPETSG